MEEFARLWIDVLFCNFGVCGNSVFTSFWCTYYVDIPSYCLFVRFGVPFVGDDIDCLCELDLFKG